MPFRKDLKTGIDMILDGDLEGKFVFNTLDCIGKGNFGKIYRGRNLHTFESVAIKTEPINSLQLIRENEAYKSLGVKRRNHRIHGFPEIYYTNNIGLQCIAMAMELLGPTLDELFKRCGSKFSLKTTLMIAIQMVNRIEYVHNCKLIHRDIKPANMLIGRPSETLPYKPSTEDTIYLIDFGVAKSFDDPEADVHVQFADGASVVGTYMFMSAKCHLNIEQSQRDDLESLGYVLLYLINGTLPWEMYLKIEDMDLIKCGEMKHEITSRNLCDGLPEEFVRYFDYVRQLENFEKPDYEMLQNLFDSTYARYKFVDDNLFDWSTVTA